MVHHPMDAELIGEHAEISAPERIHQRHGYFATGRKPVEQTVGLGLAVRIDGNRHIVAGMDFPLLRNGVAAHQNGLLADGQGNVHHPFHFGFAHFDAFL